MLTMGIVPRVRALPPLRCGHQRGESIHDVCGAAARWQRSGYGGFVYGFRCDEHRRSDDAKIPDAFSFRHVSVSCDAVFAGTTMVPSLAELEAADRLRKGVESVGGLLNLHHTRSYVAFYTAPGSPDDPNAGKRGR